MSHEISAGIIIYRMTAEGPRFLLLYHGGPYWNFPKGKIEDESSFKAALREVYEETGIKNQDLRFKSWFKVQDKVVIYKKNRGKFLKTFIYYLAETSKEEVRISDEHQGYGWFLYRDAMRILIARDLKENVKKAYAAIVQRKSVPHRPAHSPR